jgi:hypothetical protein
LKRRLSAGKRSLYGAMVIAMALAAAISPPSWACGACVEDAIAATYDHATIRAAIAKRQQVVFVSIEGGDKARVVRVLASAARKVRGVQAGTLRTAVSPPAFSFALAADEPVDTAVSAFGKLIADQQVRLTVIRIMRNGSLTAAR